MQPVEPSLDAAALAGLFHAARSVHTFTDQPVTDELLHELHSLLKLGPTAWNSQPARFVFVRSEAAKARLAPALSSSNRAKTLAAPVTVIVATDTRFYEHVPGLDPATSAGQLLRSNPTLAETTAFRNGTLQGAYLIIAARALGLTAGPMSGFKPELVDQEFLAGSSWRTNFLVNLGYHDGTEPAPRAPRLTFEQAARIL